MFGIAILERRIIVLEDSLRKKIKEIEETHKVCSACGITGHKVDMAEDCSKIFFGNWSASSSNFEYYHNGCYAEKFHKHLCPCKCGKWIDNKDKSHK